MTVTERLSSLLGQLSGPSNSLNSISSKNPNDAVVVWTKRSPLCKFGKGAFKDMSVAELMTSMLKASIKDMPVNPQQVEDITVGIVNGDYNALYARAAALTAGFPDTTCVQSINRFCSSGLMAVSHVANQIRNGEIEVGLAMGVENLSATYQKSSPEFSEEIMSHPQGRDCIMPMGWTSENVAGDFKIPREKMDLFACRSHNRAEKAHADGRLAQEIIPLEALVHEGDGKDKSPSDRKRIMVTADDGLRKGTTVEGLAKVRAAFPQWPPAQTTGGNASQVTDGAACALLMRRSKAEALGLPILGKHVMTVVSGLAPRIMGIGPSLAIPQLLKKCGLTKEDIDLYEINEAFSSMYVYCVEQLGLDPDKVNVVGGAIAFGHPFGMTGARQVATGLNELHRRKGKLLVTSMCIGSGQGAAGLFIRED